MATNNQYFWNTDNDYTSITFGDTIQSSGADTITWNTSWYENPSNQEIMDLITELRDEMKKMKSVLFILDRDVKLEEKYEEVKEAYDNYLEVLENYKAWEILITKTPAEEAEDGT